MTFEYLAEHPHTPPVKKSRRGKKSSDAEEKLEDTPVVAELRLAVAKEDVVPPEEVQSE